MKFPINKGFSLLELLIVIAVMGILLSAGAGAYRNFGKNVELDSTSRMLASDLRHMQSKSMVGEDGLRWGVSLINSADDYYELISVTDGDVNATNTTVYLPKGISFDDPAEGATKNIIFNKITGSTIATTTALIAEGVIATTTVSSIGTIY